MSSIEISLKASLKDGWSPSSNQMVNAVGILSSLLDYFGSGFWFISLMDGF